MGAHPGLEHRTVPALEALASWNGVFKPPADLLEMARTASGPGHNISPNQWATLVALRATWAVMVDHFDLKEALAQARAILLGMKTAGHMCTGGAAGYSNEPLCPDPHTRIWMHAMGAVLRTALRAKDEALLALAIDFWADHVALCLCHWTPEGVRVAAFRCDAPKGADPRPNWGLDTLLVGEICDLPTPRHYFGSRNDTALLVMRQSRALYPRILEAAKTARPVLRIPLRRFDIGEGGRYISALSMDEAANGRMSWIQVSTDGSITGSSNTLEDRPSVFMNPLVFGRGDGALKLSPYGATLLGDTMGWKSGDPAAPPAELPPPPGPTTPTLGDPGTPTLSAQGMSLIPAWLKRLNGYSLDKGDRTMRQKVVQILSLDRVPIGALRDVAAWLDRSGVNKDSPQGKDIAGLRQELLKVAALEQESFLAGRKP